MSNDETFINWTEEKLLRFKSIYKAMSENEEESFWFEGHEFLVSYAKYLIQYLESRFKGGI